MAWLAAGLALAFAAPAAHAQPLPPPRPRDLPQSVAPATPTVVPRHPSVEELEDNDHPIKTLDQATLRARMGDCAARWAQMKHEGKAAGALWRDFSRDCLDGK